MHPADATASNVVAFIGGGNMTRSLIGGLRARGVAAAHIRVVEPAAPVREALGHDFGIATFAEAATALDGAQTWVLAVKPQVMQAVCGDLSALALQQRPLVVSIAAGVTTAQLQRWLGGALPVVRCMPNTPAVLGAGITGLFASAQVDADGRARAQALLDATGHTVWIDDEALMDAVTAVSGSGPAYVFLLAEAMIDAARQQGLDATAARALTVQTILGAARMLAQDNVDAATLRRQVTSPGGTTQAAIDSFEAGGFRALVAGAINAARERGRALSATAT